MYRASDADGVDGKQLLSAFQNNVVAGEYEPGGDTFVRAARSDAGWRKIIELMLVPPTDEKNPSKWRLETSWTIYADEDAFRRACELAAEMNRDPKAVAARRRPTRLASSP